jgi:hypothetical protein
MMKKILMTLALVGLCTPAVRNAAAQEGIWTRSRISAFLTAADSSARTAAASDAVPSVRPGRSARLAGLMSAAVPGAGEIYGGSWIKAAAFMALEAAAWTGYAHYTDKGNEMRKEFRAYADVHWSRERWNSRYVPGQDPATHELPVYNTQQYYEMIGKYNQFMKGWDDWMDGEPALTPNRYHYESMRHKHNAQLINASRCGMAALGNHLLSAMDAAWTVHRKNRSLSVRILPELRMARAGTAPVLAMRAAW